MVGLSLSISLILLCLGSSANASSGWGYDKDDGPSTWQEGHPACSKNQQSPINIYEGSVVANDASLTTPMQFTNYDSSNGLTMTIKNVGHGVKISLSGNQLPEIEGAGLPGKFRAQQFHFHWSINDNQGSEHEISSKGFPSEIHIVHYNTKYENISVALDKPDGLAVLGFMIEVSMLPNPAYDEIVSVTERLIEPTSTPIELSKKTMNSFLPDSFPNFFRYSGSLTTPPCLESVTWTVFKDTIKMSADQLDAFLNLKNEKDQFISHNARPVMPINGREVLANFNPNIHWTYHKSHHDPEHWAHYYESCGKQSQSPINIPSSPAKLEASLGNITFNKFDITTGITMKIHNNGHTAQVSVSGNNLPSIQGGGLPAAEFEIAQFHFHWGSDSMRGSEHTLDAHKFPMEVHVVTWNKALGDIGSSLKKKNGLAVLGFFFEISNDDNPAMNPIVDNLDKILSPDKQNEIPLPTFSMDSFLPADRSKFYRYSGSLTTPGCFESVTWSVFDSKIKISEAQMEKFRQLISNEKEEGTATYYNIEDNYRPVQFLNSRQIVRNFEVEAAEKPHWTYFGLHGTEFWKDLVPKCGSTTRQSPIDIQPNNVEMATFDAFKYTNFDNTNGITMKLKNNGHTAVVRYESGDIQISGGGLQDEAFKVLQFHFHWGSVDTQGSEHTFDGASYPMEIHIVSRNMLYSETGVALSQGNGLAVLGFMFEISDEDNKNLEPIISALNKVTEPDTETSLTAFTLDSILPKDRSQFYRYEGSLTTPPCSEAVTWTVFNNPIPISRAQMDVFRSMKSSELDDKNNVMPLVDGFRPTQTLGARTVYSNFLISGAKMPMQAVSTTSLLSMLTYLIGSFHLF